MFAMETDKFSLKEKLDEAISKTEYEIACSKVEDLKYSEQGDLNQSDNSAFGLKINLNFTMPVYDDDDINEDEFTMEENDGLISPVVEKTTNSLLRKTISELERALKDTEKLLSKRDQENSRVRGQLLTSEKKLEACEDQINKLETQLSEKDKIIQNLEDRIRALEDEIVILTDETRRFKKEKRKTTKGKCCSAATELQEMKTKITDEENRTEVLKRNNIETVHLSQDYDDKAVVPMSQTVNNKHSTCRFARKEKDLQTQLRMKFMRDAFFYYMIDFHADEQLKAILAILEYEDKRSEIIYESHKMRQMGRRFTVSKVSSRGLTFVQEEIRK